MVLGDVTADFVIMSQAISTDCTTIATLNTLFHVTVIFTYRKSMDL